MITYVNTVLVGRGVNGLVANDSELHLNENKPAEAVGKYIIMNMDENAADKYTVNADTKKIKIGIVTKKNNIVRTKKGVYYTPIIKWSNIIDKDAIKSLVYTPSVEESEDTITIDFLAVKDETMQFLAEGGKRVIVRLTFKDLPTRYRKWTESYEYVTMAGDTADTIAEGIAYQINSQYKRARVTADAKDGVVTLVAMPYDDDDVVDSLNWANKVRFTANAYFTDPTAPAFASKNKYAFVAKNDTVSVIKKEPGVFSTVNAKLVRDREAQGMGYQGILNRGEGTWPIIKPDMETNLETVYEGITLEFENMYRSADDLFRKTKQAVEIYDTADAIATVYGVLKTFAGIA